MLQRIQKKANLLLDLLRNIHFSDWKLVVNLADNFVQFLSHHQERNSWVDFAYTPTVVAKFKMSTSE